MCCEEILYPALLACCVHRLHDGSLSQTSLNCSIVRRLRDVLRDIRGGGLYLVMEFMDMDLHEHLGTDPSARDLTKVKVK